MARDKAIAEGVPVPQKVVVVNNIEQSAQICADIVARQPCVGVDLEGVNLGRTGRLSIVTIATAEHVYLFDVTMLRETVFHEGKLRDVLTNMNIVKLLFDCRADQDALFFLYGVKLERVCDLQVMAVDRFCPKGIRVIGMKTTFQYLNLFTKSDAETKEKGGEYFVPEKGGSYDVWEVRPLNPLLVDYCAVDVKFFFLAFRMLQNYQTRGFKIGEARIEKVISSTEPLPQNSERDFR